MLRLTPPFFSFLLQGGSLQFQFDTTRNPNVYSTRKPPKPLPPNTELDYVIPTSWPHDDNACAEFSFMDMFNDEAYICPDQTATLVENQTPCPTGQYNGDVHRIERLRGGGPERSGPSSPFATLDVQWEKPKRTSAVIARMKLADSIAIIRNCHQRNSSSFQTPVENRNPSTRHLHMSPAKHMNLPTKLNMKLKRKKRLCHCKKGRSCSIELRFDLRHPQIDF
jgi:hypothetical protein